MKLLAVLVVLGMLAVLGDLVAEETAEGRFEERLSASIAGADEVEVEFHGRPFLLQALAGEIDGLNLMLPSVQRDGIEVEDVELELETVRFSPADLAEGSGDIRIGAGGGRGTVTQHGLNRALEREVPAGKVRLDPGSVTFRAAGQQVPVSSVSVEDGELRFGLGPLDPVRIGLPRFVEGIRYREAHVRDAGILILFELPRTAIDPAEL